MQRHAWNHVEQGRFLRDIKISSGDDRSAFDQIASLADSLASAEAVRIAAIRRGQGHLALRAAQTERQLSKALFTDLGIDSRDVAEHLQQANHLGRAVFRLIRSEPNTGQRLLALLDPASEVAHDLEIFLHDLTTEEPAA